MLKRLVVTIALTFGAVLPGHAMEALALKVLGFSPDGRHFGFIQYGGQGDGGEYIAETYVIDTARDRFVPGIPLRIDLVAEEAIADEVAEPENLLKLAMKRSQALIKRYDLTRPGTVLARVDEARSSEVHSGSGGPTAGSKSVTVKHPAQGEVAFNLEVKEFDWPKTSRIGAHKDAGACAREVDWQKGAGFRMSINRAGRTIVLNDDKTIPASRFCASGYGIAEVHAFDRPDGKVTVAVLVGMNARDFECDDRLFLAVTKVLER